ncbi:MAG: thiolase family protein [candidate division Zixibacteria bacterium]|nr:thiolase family protein [candidate division Zixibacteria bacterium]
MVSNKVFIVGSCRTAIGKFGGTLMKLSAADMGVVVAGDALKRSGIEAKSIEESFFGCGRQAGTGPNVARQITHRIGVPVDRPATTINMACASSIQTIIEAARAIRLGERDVVLVGGTESMSNVPHYIFGARWGIPLGKSALVDAMYHDGFHCKLCDMVMGETVDKLAKVKNISRGDQDEYALLSQNRTAISQKRGTFTKEITPVTVKSRKGDKVFEIDEHPREGATLDGFAKLKPIFGADGTVTAGNACGITDGASAMIMLSEKKLNELGVSPDVELIEYSQSGVKPELMGLGPVPAVKKLLKKSDLNLSDIDLIELNEAFAGQVLACQRELGLDMDKLNVKGGAIALGHPIGATGARIVTTLVHTMRDQNVEYGMATLCVSGGQGAALLLRNCGN